MRDRVYEFHYLPLQSVSGSGVASLQARLINPDALGDMCSMRILAKDKKVVVEGRCPLSGIRSVVEDGQIVALAKNVTLCVEDDQGCITSKHPHPAFQALSPMSELRALLDRLWLEYSDF
jgi:hypothetical protein